VIERRYLNGIKNLFEIYIPIVDELMVFDNSEGYPELIAEKSLTSDMNVINQDKFSTLKTQSYGTL
jgi:predicted ABC-type ATPase